MFRLLKGRLHSPSRNTQCRPMEYTVILCNMQLHGVDKHSVFCYVNFCLFALYALRKHRKIREGRLNLQRKIHKQPLFVFLFSMSKRFPYWKVERNHVTRKSARHSSKRNPFVCYGVHWECLSSEEKLNTLLRGQLKKEFDPSKTQFIPFSSRDY